MSSRADLLMRTVAVLLGLAVAAPPVARARPTPRPTPPPQNIDIY
jgi:hypothetical protein